MMSSALPFSPSLKKQRTELNLAEAEAAAPPVPPAPVPNKCTYLTRIRNARQLVIVTSESLKQERPFKAGKQMDQVELIEKGGMIIGHDGLIVAVDLEEKVALEYDATCTYEHDIDASEHCVIPGLCDAHTHPVWAGDRVHEFAMKLAGATYMEIHQAGGGIGFTVNASRDATEQQLLQSLLQRLDRALKLGTTLMEAKSGYGLNLDGEMKLLRVLHQANCVHPMDLVSNYCGGHSVPKGSTASEATADIIERQIPALVEEKLKGTISPELIDVFCEKNVFEIEDTKKILEAGKTIGLHINFHGDELSAIKAAELGAQLNAMAISHLEHVSDLGMKQMADRGVIGVLLPTTAYVLRIAPPPAQTMIDAGVPIALGSDFNPNAHCMSMPFVMNLACVTMKMSLNQVLNAATINAAASMNRGRSHGSFEVGKVGDFVMLAAPRWEHLVYQLVDPPITHVYKNGKCVFERRADQ